MEQYSGQLFVEWVVCAIIMVLSALEVWHQRTKPSLNAVERGVARLASSIFDILVYFWFVSNALVLGFFASGAYDWLRGESVFVPSVVVFELVGLAGLVFGLHQTSLFWATEAKRLALKERAKTAAHFSEGGGGVG